MGRSLILVAFALAVAVATGCKKDAASQAVPVVPDNSTNGPLGNKGACRASNGAGRNNQPFALHDSWRNVGAEGHPDFAVASALVLASSMGAAGLRSKLNRRAFPWLPPRSNGLHSTPVGSRTNRMCYWPNFVALLQECMHSKHACPIGRRNLSTAKSDCDPDYKRTGGRHAPIGAESASDRGDSGLDEAGTASHRKTERHGLRRSRCSRRTRIDRWRRDRYGQRPGRPGGCRGHPGDCGVACAEGHARWHGSSGLGSRRHASHTVASQRRVGGPVQGDARLAGTGDRRSGHDRRRFIVCLGHDRSRQAGIARIQEQVLGGKYQWRRPVVLEGAQGTHISDNCRRVDRRHRPRESWPDPFHSHVEPGARSHQRCRIVAPRKPQEPGEPDYSQSADPRRRPGVPEFIGQAQSARFDGMLDYEFRCRPIARRTRSRICTSAKRRSATTDSSSLPIFRRSSRWICMARR